MGGVKDYSGCDGFDVACYVTWRGNLADKFFDMLESARAEAERDPVGCRSFDWFGRTILVAGHGVKKRGGGNYRYKVEVEGCDLLIARAREPKGDWPNVLVEVGAMALLACGGNYTHAWDRVKQLLQDLGGKLDRNKLSRIDLMTDVMNVEVGEFVKLWDGGAFVCRAKRFQLHSGAKGIVPGASEDDFAVCLNGAHQKVMTLSIGKRIRCRMYDKLQELKDRDDVAKRETLIQRWGGEPEAVTRVEFQLRREALTALGVDSVEDMISRESLIVEWLTSSWLCVRQPGLDRSVDRKRSPVHSLWRRVQAGFCSGWWAHAPGVKLSPLVKRSTAESLVKQAAGCMASWAARVFGACDAGDVVALAEEFAANLVNLVGINATAFAVQVKAEKWRSKLAEGLVTDRPPPRSCPWIGIGGARPVPV